MIDKEYESLRTEMIKRIEQRHHILLVTLTIAGLFLGFGAKEDRHFAVILTYPPIAFLLCLVWAQNVARTWDIATYIRENIEIPTNRLNWEHYMQKLRKKEKENWQSTYLWWRSRFLGSLRASGAWTYGGIVLITQITAIGMGFLKFNYGGPGWSKYTIFLTLIVPPSKRLPAARFRC